MSSERPSSDIRAVWSAQETEGFTMSLDDIRARSTKFERNVRIRNLLEYAAAVVVVVWFGVYVWILPGMLLKAGSALVILGTLFVVWQLHRRASAQVPPFADSLREHMAFHRRELARQRDALRSIALWYLGPFVPGLAVLFLGMYLRASSAHRVLLPLYAGFGLCITLFALLWLLNRWGASRLQKLIDALGPAEG